MTLILVCLLLLSIALCTGPCDAPQFTVTSFDEIKTNPFTKIIIVAGKDDMDDLCSAVSGHASYLYRGLGVISYLIDQDEEKEENLATMNHTIGERSIMVQSEDGLAVRFGGVLDPEKRDAETIKADVEEFIEIRIAAEGDTLLVSWPQDGLEGVLDGGLDEIPCVIGLSRSQLQKSFVGRMATRHKQNIRFYSIECNQSNITPEQASLCELGPGLLFADHYGKYQSKIRLYQLKLDDIFNELDAARWIEKEREGKHHDEYIELKSNNKQKDVRKCIPHCDENKDPMFASPKTLRDMVEHLRSRINKLY